MNELPKVIMEPSDEFSDGLSTLASAAIGLDMVPVSKGEHTPLSQPPQCQLTRAWAAQSSSPVRSMPQIWQWSNDPTLQQERRSRLPTNGDVTTTCDSVVASDGTVAAAAVSAPAAITSKALEEPPWYDVCVVRSTSCVVSDFVFTETAIDHSADTSDRLPDYTGLHKLSLLPGMAYKFRTAALNSCGIGEWSEVCAFKTCLPGYPGAPGGISISRSSNGALLRWKPPTLRYGRITEYSVSLAVIPGPASKTAEINLSLRELQFMRVYCGLENRAFVENCLLMAAYVDRTIKPAIIFRIGARNEKGYGPSTQVRWLQDLPSYSKTVQNEANEK